MSPFQTFCVDLHRQLRRAAVLDPALAAAADFLDQREASAGQWFECEVHHIATSVDDLHAVLGARAVLALWKGAGVQRT